MNPILEQARMKPRNSFDFEICNLEKRGKSNVVAS